jgi:glutaconate CoA-transferase subunit B
MMAVALARLLHNGERVFHGVASPLPMVACLLAQHTHAPGLVYLNITGSANPTPDDLPASTVDPRLLRGARSLNTLAELFDLSARGALDTVFLSGVEIDAEGRINMSAIGPYAHPKVRLPGGAGSAALMRTTRRTLLWRTKHDRRTFVERVGFVTAAGNVDRVVTPLCIFRRVDGRLQVEQLYLYTTPDAVRTATGFALDVDDTTPVAPPPTDTELAALASIDPENVRLLEFS